MQQSDLSSITYPQYPQNPNYTPNPTPNLLDHPPPPPPSQPPQPFYASAPPFSAGFPPAPDHHSYSSSSHSPYLHHPDVFASTPAPNFQSYNPPPAPLPVTQQPQPSPTFPRYETPAGDYQPPTQQNSFYPPYDQSPNYVPTNLSQAPNTSFSSTYQSPYSNQLSSDQEKMYSNTSFEFDHSRRYMDESAGRYGSYGSGRAELGQDHYGRRPERHYGTDDHGDGVYAYQGSRAEPYGARGTAPKSSTWSSFDDFGRPIGLRSEDRPSGLSTKTVRAVPKAETQQDVKAGVQKFRVKLLAESGGQSTQDVLCQIGLDGIRMLDPSTSRTLRIYPLDTVTRCEVFDSSTLAFWSKSTVDIEPRRIRLKSNSYTTTTLLDAVTAATIQFKEMGGGSIPSESHKMAEQPAEKRKGLGWLNAIKPVNEEKDHWVPDEAVSKCTACGADFNAFNRKHHCRNCGDIFCDKCTQARIALTSDENSPVVRVCDRCKAEVSRRLSNAKEAASRSTVLHSHEDLAKKLQEEMERNSKASSGSTRSAGSGRRTKEVACPTCTVHLQVQVPSSGSETIECGVCQHSFIVSAH
ncbi:unnamed protein product [Cuscuta campestris]|uniref:FYVE-type domain-containing protein n=1 Tax=Cuscuta campestris TaxID=132261 RepID=A0A484LKB1_9ASTE|nr:unnamed protein product [Cuscuta campestris]